MANDGKANLYLKMSQVMAEISNIPKTGKNDHFKYKFVTADAVADTVRDLLSSKGIAFFAAMTGRELVEVRKGSEKTDPNTGEVTKLVSVNARWVVEFEFTFADSESGEAVTQKWLAEADSADDKGINKCATAAEKYFLLKTFIVSSADEPDADADGSRKRPQNAQNGNKPQPTTQRPQSENRAQNPAPNGLASSTGTSPQDGDGFAKDFPAGGKWTRAMLYDKTQDYFNDPVHFDNHWEKHEANYAGKTLEEAAAFVRDLHWNYDKDQCKRLVAFGQAMFGMSIDDVMAALTDANGHSVKRMVQWDGGNYAAAQEALAAWAEREAETSNVPT